MGSQPGWGPGLQSRLGSARVGSAPDSLTWRLETSALPTRPLRWLPAATIPPTVSDSGESARVCLLPSQCGTAGAEPPQAVSARSTDVAFFNESKAGPSTS